MYVHTVLDVIPIPRTTNVCVMFVVLILAGLSYIDDTVFQVYGACVTTAHHGL